MFKLTTVRQGTRSTLCAGIHNPTYRPLRWHDDTVPVRDHLLSGPLQQLFAAGAGRPREPRAIVTATSEQGGEEATG